MNYAIYGTPTSATHERFGELLAQALEERGFSRIPEPAAADIVTRHATYAAHLAKEATPEALSLSKFSSSL